MLIYFVDSKTELAIFYERERTYDELSSLFLRYQVTDRSDLDGSAARAFFRTDMIKTGLVVRIWVWFIFISFASRSLAYTLFNV